MLLYWGGDFVINLELGHLDKNVSAFSRISLEYLTLSFTLSLFAWSIKDWRYFVSGLYLIKKINQLFHGYSWLHDLGIHVLFKKLSCTSVAYILSFQNVIKASCRNNKHHQYVIWDVQTSSAFEDNEKALVICSSYLWSKDN